MKIAVLSDVHGNLPAFEAVLKDVREQGCDVIYHTGDISAIGPWPAECFQLLIETPNLKPIMGNHDAWHAFGLPVVRKMWRSPEEVAHQKWVCDKIGAGAAGAMAEWPYLIEATHDGVSLALMHYPLDKSGKDFHSIRRPPPPAWLNEVAGEYGVSIVFFGHDHFPHDETVGKTRYVDPGSVGIVAGSDTGYVIADCQAGVCTIEKRVVRYDNAALWKAFKEREVPARELLLSSFFGIAKKDAA